ncbi:MAG: ferredoxin, ferredoxin, 2Fe-2S [Candidatus Peregrinibacteria bacterium GW2011_GWF2_33_10]|nr:MAG: ferredoxin, ferredoxin, 2Fe-2S [Candidatus Peregrinibacteria bacterium GW2011_GWF2_33_10]OGJ45628.1 MAG: hypothetical protein A2263_00825 [Candidatus Peregrinibacteria bacterium RIFOXYA2_FULL_33_21]OGJ46575.1 MAG: hypothetical protein A2272_06480 [Candidatus Peregrinibacteria bacterium RIFOXYA12_FULL_33_12]OGJ51219.1 MAG: hypothetical protein A2307_01205 [Candidatus Peregrinibacteria bacterium RIFOXYB2_FULL_33_20]
MPKIQFTYGNENKTVEAETGKTILQVAQANSIPMISACGGMGICTTCMCMIEKNPENLEPATPAEKNMGLDGKINRLGCQARIKGATSVFL